MKETALTEDGYRFQRVEDGTFRDGDMIFECARAIAEEVDTLFTRTLDCGCRTEYRLENGVIAMVSYNLCAEHPTGMMNEGMAYFDHFFKDGKPC